MIQRLKILPLYCFIIIILVQSVVLNAAPGWGRKPGWLTQQPTDPAYYHGIGIIEKGANTARDYRTAARDMAQTEIASQLKVTVQSQTTVQQNETNQGTDEQYNLISESRVEAVLTDIEQVEVYEDKQQFAIYLRLSKAKYEQQAERLYAATVSEVNQLVAEAQKQPPNSIPALKLKAQALSRLATIPDLITKFDSKREMVKLGATLRSDITTWMGALQLDFKPEYYWILSKGLDEPIRIQSALKLPGGPKTLSQMSWLVQCDSSSFTIPADDQGVIQIVTSQLPPLTQQQKLVITPDIKSTLGLTLENFYSLVNSQPPAFKVNLLVRGPRVLIVSDERDLDQPLNQLYLTPLVKSALQQQAKIEFIDKAATDRPELTIEIRVNSRKSGKPTTVYGSTIYKCYADGEIRVKDLQTGKEILTRQLKDVSGAAFTDYQAASQQALDKLKTKVTETVLPDLVNLLNGVPAK